MIENIRDEIQEDKSILHPTAQILDPHKFVKEILTHDIIEKIETASNKERDPNKNSEQFQLDYFEDFFISGD